MYCSYHTADEPHRRYRPDNMTCIVQAGVVLEYLQTELEKNLYFGVSIALKVALILGANLYKCWRSASFAIWNDGSSGPRARSSHGRRKHTIFYGWAQKDNRGPDPLRLMIGAEGSLGIITRACLQSYHASVIQLQLGWCAF